MQVPKYWFTHFYVFAVAYNTCWWLLACSVYLLGAEVPEAVVETLGFLTFEDRLATTGSENVLVVLTLLLVQSTR